MTGRSRFLTACVTGILALGVAAPGTLAQDGGTPLSVGFQGDLQYLDPALAYDFVSNDIVHALYDTLVMYDSGTTIVPGLATELPTISDDGTVYTFTLRPDVPFVKHGQVVRDVTADDVVFSLNRLLRPDLLPTPSPVGGAFFSAIKGADKVLDGSAQTAMGLEAVDPSTVRITLEHPDRTFLNALAMTFGSIIPAESGYDGAAFGADPVGSGPYYLDRYTVGDKAVLKRNTSFRDIDPKAADTVEVRMLVSPENQFLQASDGTLDIMGDNLTTADYSTAMADPDLKDRIAHLDMIATSYLAMDTGPDSAFADVRVRQAVNHAIDKAEQVRLLGGRVEAMDCVLPPAMPGFDPDCHPYPHDLDKAKALMADAGVTGFATTLYTDTTTASGESARAVAEDLAQIGIEVEVVQQDWDVLLGTITQPHNAPLVLISWLQDFPDPSDFIDPILSCASAVAGGANVAWYCDPEVDAAAAKAKTETDLSAAIPLYQQIQRDIMADAPWAPINATTQDSLHSTRVPSYQMHPVWLTDLRDIPIEAQ